MPLSLPLLMPTVLAKASEHTRSDLQQRWNSCTSAQEYLDVVRSARVSASHCNMLCGTNAYIERLNLNEKVDRLADLTTGFGACEEASELMVVSAEELEVSEKAWKSISAILTQIESYLEDAVAQEEDDREGASRQPRMLARMIAEVSEPAERVGVKDSMLWNFKAKLRE